MTNKITAERGFKHRIKEFEQAGAYTLIKNSHQDVSLDEPFKPYEQSS